MKDEKQKEPEEQVEEDEEKTLTAVDMANQVAARIETANKETAKLLARQERLQVEKTLGGHADVTPQKLEETPKEYADRVMRGDVDGS